MHICSHKTTHMRSTILTLVLFISIAANAQTDKGDWLVGGNIGFRTNKNSNEFNLSPNAGYFFAKNFAAGANLQMVFEKVGTIRSSDIGLGPFARYYFGSSNFRPFATTHINYLISSTKVNGIKTSTNGMNWLLGMGAAAFINQNVAFETIAGYNYTKFSGASSNTGFSLNFGFQVYINKSKMENLKKGKIND